MLILQKNREQAAAPGGRTVWPDTEPDRNYQTKAELDALRLCQKGLEEWLIGQRKKNANKALTTWGK